MIEDEEWNPLNRVPLRGAEVVHVVCHAGHGTKRAFDVCFAKAVGGGWVARRADDPEARRARARGGVAPFPNGDGFEIGCTVCPRKARIPSQLLDRVLDAVISIGGKEIALDTLARQARQ